ncbi:hypothetical protein F5J12DRAFT_779854 [Pisolithus orientalis]|uniref:uncharacterized protein n=1 Tax=Pisolithus orientalis TaxID=936130 RepID=UPI00222533E5|nr:uncharacterized protein F5J12DRAFT_779854 [Pisolithus orientalis]KAI6030798.1 hypothetical protein F5J12DRAFT_779854 [Pisolithus orientalis]
MQKHKVCTIVPRLAVERQWLQPISKRLLGTIQQGQVQVRHLTKEGNLAAQRGLKYSKKLADQVLCRGNNRKATIFGSPHHFSGPNLPLNLYKLLGAALSRRRHINIFDQTFSKSNKKTHKCPSWLTVGTFMIGPSVDRSEGRANHTEACHIWEVSSHREEFVKPRSSESPNEAREFQDQTATASGLLRAAPHVGVMVTPPPSIQKRIRPPVVLSKGKPPGDYGELNIWAVTNGALSRSMPNEAAVNLGTNFTPILTPLSERNRQMRQSQRWPRALNQALVVAAAKKGGGRGNNKVAKESPRNVLITAIPVCPEALLRGPPIFGNEGGLKCGSICPMAVVVEVHTAVMRFPLD